MKNNKKIIQLVSNVYSIKQMEYVIFILCVFLFYGCVDNDVKKKQQMRTNDLRIKAQLYQVFSFDIFAFDRKYRYAATFDIIVNNKSTMNVVFNYYYSIPFKITFTCEGKSYILRHKNDQYRLAVGGTGLPNETEILANNQVLFSIDLMGDYVVEIGNNEINHGNDEVDYVNWSRHNAMLFRDFAVGKHGVINVSPESYSASFFTTGTQCQQFEWDGHEFNKLKSHSPGWPFCD